MTDGRSPNRTVHTSHASLLPRGPLIHTPTAVQCRLVCISTSPAVSKHTVHHLIKVQTIARRPCPAPHLLPLQAFGIIIGLSPSSAWANGPEPAHVYRCLVLASRSSVLMTCTPRPPLHPLSALVCYPTSVSSAPSMLATPQSQLRFCIGGDVSSSDCGETGRQCPPVGGLSKDSYAQGPKGLEQKWLRTS